MPNTWIELDLEVLRRNVRAVLAVLPPATRLIFVVKANAYGHGLAPVARTAWEAGVRWFAVAHMEEAAALRAMLPGAEILLTGVLQPADAAAAASARCKVLIVDGAQARALGAAAAAAGRRLCVHAKVDTGMGRLGFLWEGAAGEIAAASRNEGLLMEGLCTHFASADNADPIFARVQMARFARVASELERLGLAVPMRHVSNSGGLLCGADWDLEGVRAGILLYGYGPRPGSRQWQPPLLPDPVLGSGAAGPPPQPRRIETRPFLQWKTRVLQVKRVPAGFPVSYDSTYVTEREMCLAVLDAGYADGYPRACGNRAAVLIGGRRCPIVGRVTMNLTVAGLSADTQVRPRDEAVLLGRQDRAAVWADELAVWAGTIPYEILTGIRGGPIRYEPG